MNNEKKDAILSAMRLNGCGLADSATYEEATQYAVILKLLCEQLNSLEN